MPKLNINSAIFKRGVADVITKKGLRELLSAKRPLRVKHGIDATSPDLHLGHAANLWKIRALQEQGHKAVIILGDFTTSVGDPTGRLQSRPLLQEEQINRNISSIKSQIENILLADSKLYEIRRNSEWFAKFDAKKFLQILTLVTHARLIERDMFQERIKKGKEILMSEFLYPVLQGYDSVAVESDLTVIGSDQIFNEHLGRYLQEKFSQKPQVIVALDILPGLDGKAKMSKSASNFIGLKDSPQEKFGKIMSIPDGLIIPYLESYTAVSEKELMEWREYLQKGSNPRNAKIALAKSLVERYHGSKTAEEEKERFISTFSAGNAPEDAEVKDIPADKKQILEALVFIGAAPSRSEARRLLKQEAIDLDGKMLDPAQVKDAKVKEGMVVRVGKKKFFRIGKII